MDWDAYLPKTATYTNIFWVMTLYFEIAVWCQYRFIIQSWFFSSMPVVLKTSIISIVYHSLYILKFHNALLKTFLLEYETLFIEKYHWTRKSISNCMLEVFFFRINSHYNNKTDVNLWNLWETSGNIKTALIEIPSVQ